MKAKHFKKLMKFMEGQTVDESGIYEEDFLRWFYKMRVVD